MAPRVPPSVVVSVGDASNSTKGRVLAQLDRKVSQCLFTVHFANPCAYPGAFIDELKTGIASAGNSLPSTAPGIQLIFVVETTRDVQAVREAVRLMWSCGSGDVAVFPLVLCLDPAVSPRELIFPGVRSFLLPKCWRGTCLQGPARRTAGEALLLTFVATQASRVPASTFECFDRTRFDRHEGVLLAAIDRYALPDFDREAERLLLRAVAFNYVPEVSPQARAAAESRGVDQPELILRSSKPKSLLEFEDAEKVLCSAIAQSYSVEQAAAVLGGWAAMATGDAISFLGIWRWHFYVGKPSSKQFRLTSGTEARRGQSWIHSVYRRFRGLVSMRGSRVLRRRGRDPNRSFWRSY